MAVLVTGGAGYIGSHTVVELLNKGEEVVIIDDFSNSKSSVLDAIKEITKKDFKFYEGNYLNRELLEKIFEENRIDSVINVAGFKAVGESVQKPLEYYQTFHALSSVFKNVFYISRSLYKSLLCCITNFLNSRLVYVSPELRLKYKGFKMSFENSTFTMPSCALIEVCEILVGSL